MQVELATNSKAPPGDGDVKLAPQPSPAARSKTEGAAVEAKRKRTCAEAARSPTAFIGWGCVFCVTYCVVTAVATHVHWPQSDLCAFPPLQDDNSSGTGRPSDYPNPRCPDYTRFANDTGPYWYYWRAADYMWFSQLTAWVFYVSHQMAVWYLVFRAQLQVSSDTPAPATAHAAGRSRDGDVPTITLAVGGGAVTAAAAAADTTEPLSRGRKYSKKMRGFNWWSLGLNAFFVVLHLLQTHFMGYDALAPSVHEMSSQGSVILLLVIVMMMETDRRGMFFGQPIGLYREALDVAKRYHGYVFSWAVIFTFWYHPMEGYLGHLFGIFHVLIIMLQGSLMFTDAHLNRLWRMVLEAWVFVHAAVISTQTLESNSWPMFVFGFGAIFVISQLPGLPCLLRCHVAVRLVPCAVFAALYVAAYVLVEQWTSPAAVAFIPSAIYLGAIALNLVLMLGLTAGRRCCCHAAGSCARGAGQRPAASTRQLAGYTTLAFLIMCGVTVCAVVSEVAIDRDSFLATLLVYGSICVGVLFLLLVLPLALPRPRNEARRDGCTGCCFWKPPPCCQCLPHCGRQDGAAAAAAATEAVSPTSAAGHSTTDSNVAVAKAGD